MLEVKNLFLQRVFSPHLGIHINSLSDFNVSLFGKDDLEKQGKMITWLKEAGKNITIYVHFILLFLYFKITTLVSQFPC